MRLLPFTLAALVLLTTIGGCSREPWAGVTPEQFARLNEHRIIGTALLENGKKIEAASEFVAIQKLRPNLAFGFVNEAACYVRDTTKTASAVKAAERGASLAPQAVWPLMVLAQVQRDGGATEKATETLEKALRLGPGDVRAIATLARHLREQPGNHQQRIYELRKKLVELAPQNLAAQIHWFEAQLDAAEMDAAGETLNRIEALIPRPTPDTRDYLGRARKALAAGGTEAGLEARALVNILRGERGFQPAQAALYGSDNDPAAWLMRGWTPAPPRVSEPALAPVALKWVDVTGDAGLDAVKVAGVAPVAVGDVDLWPSAGKAEGGRVERVQDRPDLLVGASSAAWLGSGQAFGRPGTWSAAAGSPLLLDLNNDFSLDAYLAGETGDAVWRNPISGKQGEHGLEQTVGKALPATPRPGPAGPGAAVAVDLDQDGDLDVLRTSAATGQPAIRYLRNNGNFSLTDLTQSGGLNLPSAGARQALYGDFDGDGDPDVFVVRSGAGCALFLNQRQDLFRNASAAWGLKADAGARSAVVGDFDRDGDWDVAVVGRAPHGSVLYRNAGGKFIADAGVIALPGGFEPDWVDLLDYDNDTWLDLVIAGKGGVTLVHNDGGKFASPGAALAEACRWATWVDYDQDGDTDLLAVTAQNQVRLLRNDGGNARPWLRLELQGYIIPAANMGETGTQANNSYGVSAEIEPRTLWDAQRQLATRPQMHLGLGRADRALAVQVLWAHGVPQDVVRPESGGTAHFTQVPTNSCPYLYTWDGQGYRFAKDFLWRSPLGMLAARGKPIPHGLTSDWTRLPGSWLNPAGGYYRIAATEELREISYFDSVRLLAVDHPDGTGVYVDERFPFGAPPAFRIYTTRNERAPAAAVDGAGRDLLPALRAEDNVFTPVPGGPYRGVRAPHDLILDLGKLADPGDVRLYLSGWIFPPPNSTNVNGSQNPDLPWMPPTLSFGDGKGGWVRPDAGVGLPCGKRKTIVLDLSGRFTPGDYRVKLTTTYEIRWDRAFFTVGEAPLGVKAVDMPLVDADLAERGISERYWEAGDGPDLRRYDSVLEGERAPAWPAIPGAYTRLGECSPLLRAADDRYVIMAPGDEIRLLFDGRALPPPAPGFTRDFVLMSDGWTKDTDRNTVAGETVGPLPFHGMKRYPYGPDERFPDSRAHRAWQRDWNTRVIRR